MDAHPETGVCFSWVKVIDENENEVPDSVCNLERVFAAENRTQGEWLHQFYSKGSVLCHTSAFIRREAIEVVGIYNYPLLQIQDLELWTRIAKKYALHVICEPLVYYRWFLSSTPNASAPSPEVIARGTFEFFYLLQDFHNGLSDDLFAEAFRKEFINKDAATHNELRCERALLMLKPPYLVGNSSKIIALLMLNQLLQEDETRELLFNVYHFTIKDYNRICAEKLFYEFPTVPVTNDKGEVFGEVTLKGLIKKHLQRNPGLFSIAKKTYHVIRKP